jgi:hypothetical protein
MTADEHLRAFIQDGQESDRLKQLLSSPTERYELYRLMGKQPPRPYRRLLLRLLDVEIAFRTAIWEGSAEADEESAEGIFHCAYLLSRCGEPADAKALWKAQYLNQDVGELEVGYFVGAGVPETLKFLANENDESAQEIAGYIRDSLQHPQAIEWLASWQASRHAWLAD